MQDNRLLSAECLAVADALRDVRRRLCEMIAEGQWPTGVFADISTIEIFGLEVAEALERLGSDRPAK